MAWTTLFLLLLSAADPKEDPRDIARRLEEKGDLVEAFQHYLHCPGGEADAARIARSRPRFYLSVLARTRDVPPPRWFLVEGDLRLALGDQHGALACYRRVVGLIAARAGQGWKDGLMPADYYPVQTGETRDVGYAPGAWSGRGGEPFEEGPGSHRDNWLIRRFITLSAWEDASREFARIADLHRTQTQPFVVRLQAAEEGGKDTLHVATPAGFSSAGLLFALDHAFFCKQRGQPDQALKLLLEPIGRIDLTQGPDNPTIGPPLPADKPLPFPERPHRWHIGLGLSAGWNGPFNLSHLEYLRLAFGEFKNAGREDLLVAELEKAIRSGYNPARRTLARIRMLQGQPAAALDLELAHLNAARLPEPERLTRLSEVYQTFQKNAEAIDACEKRLLLPEPGPVLDRLRTLLVARGDRDKVLRLDLLQFDLDPERIRSSDLLNQAKASWKGAGREKEFRDWALDRYETTCNLLARAELAWLAGEWDLYARSLADAGREQPWTIMPPWLQRFDQRGKTEACRLLRLYLSEHPKDPHARLLLLEREGRLETVEAARALEEQLILSIDKGQRLDIWQLPSFLRILRLYDSLGHKEDVVRLGMAAIDSREPFPQSALPPFLIRKDSNRGWNIALDILTLVLPHVTRPEDLRALRNLADKSEVFAVRNLVARRLAGRTAVRVDADTGRRMNVRNVRVQTANLPGGLFLGDREDIRCVAGDWAGTGWGLVRYRAERDTLVVTQVWLGEEVTSLCQTPHGLFAGTAFGVYAIEDAGGDNPRPARIPLEKALEVYLPPQRIPAPSPRRLRSWNTSLLWFGKALWIGGAGEVFRYDPARRELENHTTPRNDRGEQAFERPLFIAANRLWASHAVFDEKKGEFIPLKGPEYPWRLIGGTGDEVWAAVMPGKKWLWRPALVDPRSLEFRVVPLDEWPDVREGFTQQELRLLGHDGRRTWLSAGGALLEYDRSNGTVRRVADPRYPHAGLGGRLWENAPDGGVRVVGTRGSRGVPYDLTNWYVPSTHRTGTLYRVGTRLTRDLTDHGIPRTEGLFDIDVESATLVKLGTPQGQLAGLCVRQLLFDDDRRQVYVATNGGLTILSLPGHEVVARFTHDDGLPDNRIRGIEFSKDRRKLVLRCGEPSDHTELDLGTWLVRRDADPQRRRQSRDTYAGADKLPDWIVDVTRSGKRYRGGKLGLFILDEKGELPAEPKDGIAHPRPTPDQTRQAEAKSAAVQLREPADLERLLKHPNPWLRARAVGLLARMPARDQGRYLTALAPAVGDSSVAVRRAVLDRLLGIPGRESTRLLGRMVRDRDREIRLQAVLAVGQRDGPLDPEVLAELLQHDGSNSQVFALLLSRADPDALRLLVQHPSLHQFTPADSPAYDRLARTLARSPELFADLFAQTLRQATERHPSETSEVFLGELSRRASQVILPALHRRLTSRNRQERALSCSALWPGGSVRVDPVPPQSPGPGERPVAPAVVDALARLKAKEAIPDLVKLYLDASQDDGSGFRAGQLGSQLAAQYDRLGSLDDLGRDWETLRRDGRDDRPEETLLDSQQILEAVRRIGSGAAQGFYRSLAGSWRTEARVEAAAGLAGGEGKDRTDGEVVLRVLVSDSQKEVGEQAVASLACLGDKRCQQEVLGALKEKGEKRERVVEALFRVRNVAGVAFARAALEVLRKDSTLPMDTRERADALLRGDD